MHAHALQELLASGEACSDPFTLKGQQRLVPGCNTRCCDGDIAGGFSPVQDLETGRQEWQPQYANRSGMDAGTSVRRACEYFDFSAEEVRGI